MFKKELFIMNKQNVFALILLTIVLLAVVAVSGCIGGSGDDDSANDASGDSDDSSDSVDQDDNDKDDNDKDDKDDKSDKDDKDGIIKTIGKIVSFPVVGPLKMLGAFAEFLLREDAADAEYIEDTPKTEAEE